MSRSAKTNGPLRPKRCSSCVRSSRVPTLRTRRIARRRLRERIRILASMLPRWGPLAVGPERARRVSTGRADRSVVRGRHSFRPVGVPPVVRQRSLALAETLSARPSNVVRDMYVGPAWREASYLIGCASTPAASEDSALACSPQIRNGNRWLPQRRCVLCPEAQAIFCRRRHHASRLPPAKSGRDSANAITMPKAKAC